MNVVLCSSKHSFPKQLESSGLQLGSVNLIEAEEPPPCAVWKFLTQDKKADGEHVIGMGEQLAKLSIALVGGNVYLIQLIVKSLLKDERLFTGRQVVKNIEGGLAVKGMVEIAETRSALDQLTRLGYTVVADTSVTSKLLDVCIAGLVTANFYFFSPLKAVVKANDEVLVPSSSGLRNRIAYELHLKDSGGVSSPAPCGTIDIL